MKLVHDLSSYGHNNFLNFPTSFIPPGAETYVEVTVCGKLCDVVSWTRKFWNMCRSQKKIKTRFTHLELNITLEKIPSQKESNPPTIIFAGAMLVFGRVWDTQLSLWRISLGLMFLCFLLDAHPARRTS